MKEQCTRGLLSGLVGSTQHTDLRAAAPLLQVPFSGLSCADVEAMCADQSSAAAAAAGPLKRFVAVKTYRAGCAAASSVHGSSQAVTGDAASVQPLAAALRKHPSVPLSTAFASTAVPALLALGMALFGAVALVQHFTRSERAQPLLGE